MDWNNILIGLIAGILVVTSLGYFRKDKEVVKNNADSSDNNDLKVVSRKLIVPLRIQACERLMLYVERIQFPVLVKRVFYPGISRNDFQFSLMQNVQDEFEHNLAQRLYVSEDTWKLIDLAKEEVLQNINAVFTDNPDADVAMIAQKLASFENPMVEKSVVMIKLEFNSL